MRLSRVLICTIMMFCSSLTCASILPTIVWPKHVRFDNENSQIVRLSNQLVEFKLFDSDRRLVDVVTHLAPTLPEPNFYQVLPQGISVSGVQGQTHWLITLFDLGTSVRGQFSAMRVAASQLRLPDWLLPEGDIWMSLPGLVQTWLVRYQLNPDQLKTAFSDWLKTLGWRYAYHPDVWIKQHLQLSFSIQADQRGSLLYAHLTPVEE